MTRMTVLSGRLGLRSVARRPWAQVRAGLFVAAALLLVGTAAWAAPFTTDLTITGDIGLVAGSQDGSATLTGDFSTTEGGTTTTSTFVGTTVTGANPLMGTLTDFGDGFGMSADFDALFESDFDGIGIDLGIDITNTSVTDTYQITFAVDFDHSADADGTDAFADSELTIDIGGVEELFTQVISDTAFGDELNGTDLSTLGATVSDADTVLLDIVLAPGAMTTLVGEWTMQAGVFDDPGAATLGLLANVTVADVVNLTPPQAVPEPGTLPLFGMGLLGLLLARQRHKKRHG